MVKTSVSIEQSLRALGQLAFNDVTIYTKIAQHLSNLERDLFEVRRMERMLDSIVTEAAAEEDTTVVVHQVKRWR